MIDIYISNGFTYFDTAYGYIGQRSETALKECLVERYSRDKFAIADKPTLLKIDLFSGFIEKSRIKKVKELLENPHEKIYEIAKKVGYDTADVNCGKKVISKSKDGCRKRLKI